MIHLVPVFISTFIYMALGMLWYSPWLFGSLWMKEAKLSGENLRSPWIGLLGGFFVAFIMSYALAWLAAQLHIRTISEGICLAFIVWLGFIATSLFSTILWENKSFKLYLINTAFLLLFLAISGSILSFWR